MPKISKFKQKKIFEIKIKAYKLHVEGLTLREIAHVLPRSRQWIMHAIREVEKAQSQPLDI